MEQEIQYDPSTHLSYGDLAVDNLSDPRVISMLIKKSNSQKGPKILGKSVMLNSSYGCLPVSKGKQFRSSLPMGVRNPFVEVVLCKICKSSFRAG